jgi:DNA-binding NarL/FixJ family response regulator
MESAHTTPRPDTVNTRRIRTLLVDDSEFMRAHLARLMEKESDFEVVGAAIDGRHALQLVAALRPDLILMDVRMPCLDGLEATRVIRQAGAQFAYAPKIVILTSENPLTCRREAEKAGADAFVPKSEKMSTELRLTLRSLFFGNRNPAPASLVELNHESSCV